MRVRLTFEKNQAMRYTSHLDLQRTWERTIRRAQLPLAYSQGFNPRPKLVLAAALPLGITSECEIVEFWLKEELPHSLIETALNLALPPGILISRIESIELSCPKLPNLMDMSIYEVTLLESTPNLGERIANILQAQEIIRERRGKKYDLRPLILTIEEIAATSNGEQRIRMDLLAKPGRTGRPDEVIKALEIEHHLVRIHRKELILDSSIKA
jgi:radical SAM-linked protein